MRRYIFLSFLAAFFLSSPVGANSEGKLQQRILPMDCVFTEVNDGRGTVIYVTPKECGVDILPDTPILPGEDAIGVNTSVFLLGTNLNRHKGTSFTSTNPAQRLLSGINNQQIAYLQSDHLSTKSLSYIDQTVRAKQRIKAIIVIVVLLFISFLIILFYRRRGASESD